MLTDVDIRLAILLGYFCRLTGYEILNKKYLVQINICTGNHMSDTDPRSSKHHHRGGHP